VVATTDKVAVRDGPGAAVAPPCTTCASTPATTKDRAIAWAGHTMGRDIGAGRIVELYDQPRET
jgi:hypothetical protein